MVYSELEAAEALAGLGRYSSSSHISPSPDWDLADKRYKKNRELEKIVETVPDRSCRPSHQLNSTDKTRKKMNEAEKESKKLRRILANRESARQTIRRRQALHEDLARKAAELTEENVKLKEAKKLAMEGYNSVKDRNIYLKKQLAKVEKKKAARSRERQEKPMSEMSRPVTNIPIYPSLLPCFWPSVLPPSEVFQFQCPDHTDLTSSSQFLVPNREIPCCSHRNSTPIYVLPVPWLFPYQPNATTPTMFHSNVATNDVQNEILSTQTCSMCSSSDNRQLSLDLNLTAAEVVSDSTRTTTCVCSMQGPHLTLQPEGCSVFLPDINTVPPTHEHSSIHLLLPNNQEPKMHHLKRPDESFAASEARRKRKELMRLKNTHLHHVPTQY